MSEPDYLIRGTALELVRWILTSDKALETEFSNFGLFQIKKYKGEETHKQFHMGYLMSILAILVANFGYYTNHNTIPLGIVLLTTQ